MQTKCGCGDVVSACDQKMSTQAEIIRLKEKAASGDPAAQRQLGWIYQTGDGVTKDLVQSLEWYKKAALQGYAIAQNDVGCAYNRALGVEQNFAEAIKWFRMSADQGYSFGQYNLAQIYYSGNGTPVNYPEAVKWFSKAAEQGNPTAAYYLGWLYCTGNGVEKSFASALFWYRMAASEGIAGAQNNLAIMIENGQGVATNLEEAIKLYRKSAKQGNESAKKALERLKIPIIEPEIAPTPARKNPIREPKASLTESTECKTLLSACTPLVYAHNAFRITGLHVDASVRDIKRRIDDLKAAAEMGDAEDEHTHAFALSPAPPLERIREAAQRLQDPERRLIEEFFWFWPNEWGQGQSDQALTALRKGDKDAAFKIWSHASKNGQANPSVVAKHNLAVMYQMVALDSEYLALKSNLSPEQFVTVADYWTKCFKWWEELADDENFWSLVANRIRIMDDQQITTGFARRMRYTFPIAFDQINAMLAVQYAEKGKYERAKKHIAYMNETHQGSDDIERVISDILKPLETRVNSAVEKAIAGIKQEPEKGADLTRELLDATKKPLDVIRSLLDEEHTIRSYLFEQVSDACFSCLIAYGNKTEDWPTCVALLKLTEPIAVTDEARKKIRTNIAQAEENHHDKILYGMCWFCKKAKAVDSAVLEVPMHGEVNREWRLGSTHVTWKKLSAKVPRCVSCKEAHSKVAGKWTGAAAGAAVGTAVMPVVGSVIGFIAGAMIGHQVDAKMRLPVGVNAESTKADYPPIKEMIAKGWAIGEKPT